MNLCVLGVAQKQLPHFFLVARVDHLTEEHVDILRLLLFLLESAVVADHCEGNQQNDSAHGNDTADIVERSDEEGQNKCGTGGDEPAADNGNHTGNAVNCGLTSPSSVGK